MLYWLSGSCPEQHMYADLFSVIFSGTLPAVDQWYPIVVLWICKSYEVWLDQVLLPEGALKV